MIFTLFFEFNKIFFFFSFQEKNYSILAVIFLLLTLLFSIILVLVPVVNSVYSVMFFILIIINASFFVGVFSGFLFLSFSLILIYVGAISVLFIFTLMLLNTSINILNYKLKTRFFNINVIYHFFYYLISIILFFMSELFYSVDYMFFNTFYFKEFFFDFFFLVWNDIVVLGFYLYFYRSFEIFILVYLLISGMICAISIVVNKSFLPKIQNENFQLNTCIQNDLYFNLKKIEDDVDA